MNHFTHPESRRRVTRVLALVALISVLLASVLLVGCADAPVAERGADAGAMASGAAVSTTSTALPATAAMPSVTFASPWRTVTGGFLAPPTPAFGLPARPGTGMFVKWLAPGAIALRGNDLLVADIGTGRLWRADIGLQTVSGLPGVPATLGTALALGPDHAAWVLDTVSREVLRFSRDARLMQSFRAGSVAAVPGAFALTVDGATLLVADTALAQWAELRPVGAINMAIRPVFDNGQRITGVDALASLRDGVYVLDRAAARVHRVTRDGRVLVSLGVGDLKQPVALAADRFERAFIVDAQDGAIKVLRAGDATVVLTAAMLGVQQIGGIAVDDRVLAVADRLLGQVKLFTLRDGAQR